MENNGPIQAPNVSEEVVSELERISDDKKIRWQRYKCQETLDHLSTIRAKVNGSADFHGFWPFTLMSDPVIRKMCSLTSDREALSYLTDIELIQDPKDPRPYELIWHFKENPYFSNSTLTKKYQLPKDKHPAPSDGSITDEMRAFDSDVDLDVPAVPIDWKSEEKNLVKRYPREKARQANGEKDDDDYDYEFEGDIGSFFCYFSEQGDTFDLGLELSEDLLPNAIDYFTGKVGVVGGANPDSDSEDELDEEGGSSDEEIDLEEEEEPVKKRRKA